MHPIAEWDAPSPDKFRDEIARTREPAILRRVAPDWPLVVAAGQGADRCMAILAANADTEPVQILRADPEERGRFHYAVDGRSLNFIRGHAPLPTFLAALHEQAAAPEPFALVVQGAIAERHVPGFRVSHPMPLAPPHAEPRLWIGNAAKVATHNDPTDNIAVVAAGRRRFTLFPPDAEPDLYMGPDHPTPAGTPVSMVDVTAPDLVRYPRYAAALEVAREAVLGAGDAIFIPANWFHHVEALEPFNLLVNYWWAPNRPEPGSW